MTENKEKSKKEKFHEDALAYKKKIKRLRRIFKKYKKAFGYYKDTADFEEPVLQLMRGNQKVEFFEGVPSGRFYFDHSDGSERFIMLSQKYLHTFPYGDKVFRGYVCHEDSPTPYPDNAVQTADLMMTVHAKTLGAEQEWKIKKGRLDNSKIKEIFKGVALLVAVVLGLMILSKMFGVTLPWENVQQVAQSVPQTVVNGGQTLVKNITRFN